MWAYGGNGKVSSITDGNSRRTDITYTGSENKINTIKFGANDAAVSGSYSFAYTTGHAVVTDPNSHTATYVYNDTTKVISTITDGRGKTTGNQFNAHGDLLKTTNPLNDATTYDVATSTYNLTKITSPTGGTGGTGAAGRTAQYVFPTPAGNGATADYRPTSAIDAQGNTTALTYNTWGQTATAAVGTPTGGGSPAGGTWSYKYQGGSGTTAASCGGKPGQLCSVTDGKGNVTGYAYNAAGNLTTMTPPAGMGAHTFSDDAAGRKTSEVDGKGTTTYTCYDRYDRILQVSTTSSNCAVASGVTYTFTNNLLGQVTQEKTSSATTRYVRDPAGTLIGMQDNSGANYFYVLDNVKSALMLVNGAQTASATYTYDAFGNTLTNTGTSGINTTNHYRYATGYTDPTGLTKLGARYYNPALGRFTQTDPAGQDTNAYAYSMNNPAGYSDPLGLSTATDIIAVTVGVIGLASGIGAIAGITAATSIGAALWGVAQFEVGVVGLGLAVGCSFSENC